MKIVENTRKAIVKVVIKYKPIVKQKLQFESFLLVKLIAAFAVFAVVVAYTSKHKFSDGSGSCIVMFIGFVLVMFSRDTDVDYKK